MRSKFLFWYSAHAWYRQFNKDDLTCVLTSTTRVCAVGFYHHSPEHAQYSCFEANTASVKLDLGWPWAASVRGDNISRRRVAGVSRSHPTPFTRQVRPPPLLLCFSVAYRVPHGNIFMKVKYSNITCTLLSDCISLGIYSPNLDIPPHQPPMTTSHLLEIGDYI